jgi:hypothetical protein
VGALPKVPFGTFWVLTFADLALTCGPARYKNAVAGFFKRRGRVDQDGLKHGELAATFFNVADFFSGCLAKKG